MNNFKFLNLLNPQIVRAKNVGKPLYDDKYFIEIPAVVGYDKLLSCSLYLYITEKLLPSHDGNELYDFITTFQNDIVNILLGTDDFRIGEDYFISASLFEYCLEFMPVDDSSEDSSDNSSDSSDSSENSSDSSEEPWEWDPDNYIILVGPDIVYTMNLQQHTAEWIENRRNEVLDIIDDEIDNDSTTEEYISAEQRFKDKNVMPDYIQYYNNYRVRQNTDAWYDLFNTNNKDMANLEYFYNKNQVRTFTEEELRNIPNTFFNIILRHAVAQNYYTNTNNQIYNLVMRYFANNGVDDTSTALKLVLGSMYSTSQQTINCGCDSQSNSTLNTSSCADMYDAAMLQYLKQMLGDDEYYNDWFFIPIDGKCPMPNDVMIDLLIELLTLFLSMNFDLSFSKSNGHCMCPSVDLNDSICNRTTIENYIKVLNWVKNNDIEANTNKIKIYGEQFGELLPKLVF